MKKQIGDNLGTLESFYVQRNNLGSLVSNYAAPCLVLRVETIISLPQVTLPVILSVLIALIEITVHAKLLEEKQIAVKLLASSLNPVFLGKKVLVEMLFFLFFVWQAELRAAVFLALEEQDKVEVREP